MPFTTMGAGSSPRYSRPPTAAFNHVQNKHGLEIYDRLAVIKRRFDPDNLFRLNHNIQPV